MDSFFQSAGELLFFDTIQKYLMHEADWFLSNILGNVYVLLTGIMLSLMTIWVLIHGYRIMSGQSRESLMGFMMTAGKAVAILTVAGVIGASGGTLFKSITDGVSGSITYMVTGDSTDDPYSKIDDNLKLMQTGLGAMKAIDTGGDESVESERTQALWMSGIGTAGPAVVAGTLLIINKFGMALFIGLAPVFILFLLFDQTKPMFQTWLKFGLGLMVSMAVLTFMSEISMRMVGALAVVAFTQSLFTEGGSGFTAAAMQQGGLGLILTALLITVPNMATNFIGTAASGFIGANAMGSYGSVPQAGGGHGGGGSGGTGVYGGAPPNGVPSSAQASGSISNQGAIPNQSARHTIPTDSGSTNYSQVRTDSAMGAATGSSITSAQNGSVAAPSGVTAYTGSGAASSFASPSASVQSTTPNAGDAQPMSRSYAEIAGGAVSGSQAAAFGGSSSNAGAQSLASSGGGSAPIGSTEGGGANPVASTRTAGASGNDYTQIPKGKQNPAREG